MVPDGLGSVRSVADNISQPQETRFYDPYGVPAQTSGSSQSVFGFTGEETDANGLVNLRARLYNPIIGQFMGLDPLEGNAEQPVSLNRYGYVQNNVFNFRDPSGHQRACLNPESCPDDGYVSTYAITKSGFPMGVSVGEWEDHGFYEAQILPNAQNIPQPPSDGRYAYVSVFDVEGWNGTQQMAVAYDGTPTTLTHIQQGWLLAVPATSPSQSNTPATLPPTTATNSATKANDPCKQRCDPQIFTQWWNSLLEVGRSAVSQGVPDYDYEQRVARNAPGTLGGDRARQVPAGRLTVDTDGAIASDCRLIDAKFAKNPKKPQYRLDPPPWFSEDELNKLDDEILRYSLAIRVSNGVPGAQPSKLEIRTNASLSVPFFQQRLVEHGYTIGIDGFVTPMP